MNEDKSPIARALTIAGSDSGGGAGIEADLKTFTVLKVYGAVALTSVTAQNTLGVLGIQDLDPDFVARQIDAVASDIGVDAAKTGMLSNAAIVEVVADRVAKWDIARLVVDPVMIAKGGAALLKSGAVKALKTHLLPRAYIVTPNIPEAEALSGMRIAGPEDVPAAAEQILALGCPFVLIKGGHLEGPYSTDYLCSRSEIQEFSSPRIASRNTHGTGCTYSAAITAYLARGFDVFEAVQSAKFYLTKAIESGFDLGRGHGPLNHFWAL